jgi:hypothetical protein
LSNAPYARSVNSKCISSGCSSIYLTTTATFWSIVAASGTKPCQPACLSGLPKVEVVQPTQYRRRNPPPLQRIRSRRSLSAFLRKRLATHESGHPDRADLIGADGERAAASRWPPKKITRSFPRKRESRALCKELGPRLRGYERRLPRPEALKMISAERGSGAGAAAAPVCAPVRLAAAWRAAVAGIPFRRWLNFFLPQLE